jgi:hypothetical protein
MENNTQTPGRYGIKIQREGYWTISFGQVDNAPNRGVQKRILGNFTKFKLKIKNQLESI